MTEQEALLEQQCAICTAEPENCNNLHIFYLIGSILTMCGCVFVMITYMYNAKLREHPAILIFSRCIFDFCFALCFFIHYFMDPQDLACHPHHCNTLGTIILFCFLSSQGYFAAFIHDLYKSLSNPFSQPHSYVKQYHFFIAIIAAALTVFVHATYSFTFRLDLQYCAIAPSVTDVNPYNLMLIYVPIGTLIVISISVNIYATKRLRVGLEDTFYIRMQAIKDSLFYCIGYTLFFMVLGLSYLMVWKDDQIHDDSELQDENGWHYLYALTVGLLGVNDMGLWVYRQFTAYKSKEEKKNIYAKIANLGSLSKRHKTSIRRNKLDPKQFITPALPQHIAYMESDSTQTQDEKRSKCAQCCKRLSFKPTIADQSINKALRREVLAYTTDGIAQSIDRQLKMAQTFYDVNDLNDGVTDNDYPQKINEPHGRTIQQFNITIKHNKHLLYEDEDLTPSGSDVSDPEVDRSAQAMKKKNHLDPQNAKSMQSKPVPSRVHTKMIIGGNDTATTDGTKDREFVDFAPMVFKYVRNNVLGISDQDYIQSMIPSDKYAQRNVLDAKFGEGKSGAFFYFSHDSRFLVKTIKKFEVEVMLNTLKDYVQYVSNNPNTILSRVVGLHSIRMYGLVKYFVVTENVFLSELKPSEQYDLKGSWVNRYTKYSIQSGKTLKDGDLKRFIVLNEETRAQVIKQLQSDSKFLADCDVMDYSLLLGIYHMKMSPNEDIIHHEVKEEEEEEKEAMLNNYAGGIRAEVIEGPGLYYMGIIDTLQNWSFSKKMEHLAKTLILRQNKLGISCIEPIKYQKRFMNYMKNIIVTDNEYFAELRVAKTEFQHQNMLVYPGKEVVAKSMEQAFSARMGSVNIASMGSVLNMVDKLREDSEKP